MPWIGKTLSKPKTLEEIEIQTAFWCGRLYGSFLPGCIDAYCIGAIGQGLAKMERGIEVNNYASRTHYTIREKNPEIGPYNSGQTT